MAEDQVDQAQRDALLARLTRPIDRREFMRLSMYAGTTAGLGALLAACGAASPSASAIASAAASQMPTGRTIKLGYVTPSTGPIAAFAEADEYVFAGVRDAFGSGIVNGGTAYPIEIIPKDSQSDPNRAAEVATELILDDEIDLMLVASTPETTNPVADQCEANGIPCISTVAPWQPYVFGRQPNVPPPEAVPFEWTYHFFWGLEDIIAVFLDMWEQVSTNKTIGALWPNDGDGQAWGDPTVGFPPAFDAAGYSLIDPGRYENLTPSFSTQVAQFKLEGVEIVTGVPIPPDFTNFWKEAAQQGFTPKIASVGKALLFPSSVEALGELGDGLSSEYWWGPTHPFSSSLTGESAQELADGYTAAENKQWTQPIGFAHALFELAADVIQRTTSVDDKAAIRDAITATSLDTIVGHVEWTGDPFPNVAKTPLVGGQWVPGSGDFEYDLVVVSNKDHPDIPATATLKPIPGS